MTSKASAFASLAAVVLLAGCCAGPFSYTADVGPPFATWDEPGLFELLDSRDAAAWRALGFEPANSTADPCPSEGGRMWWQSTNLVAMRVDTGLDAPGVEVRELFHCGDAPRAFGIGRVDWDKHDASAQILTITEDGKATYTFYNTEPDATRSQVRQEAMGHMADVGWTASGFDGFAMHGPPTECFQGGF